MNFMKSTITIAFLLLLGFFQNAKACDCFIIPTFCESITFDNNGQVWDYLSVYRIKVEAALPNGLKVSVFQTYAGEDMAGHQLFIKDGDGANCVLFASTNLNVNQEYIIAAQLLNDTLSVSECGISFLKIENGMVQGAIAPGVTAVALADFPNTANCGDLSPSVVVDPGVLGGIIVRPTITNGLVEIRTNSGQLADLKLTVFDATGRLVFRAAYPKFGAYSNAEVDMTNWSSGVYFLHFEAAGARLSQKLVKVGSQ